MDNEGKYSQNRPTSNIKEKVLTGLVWTFGARIASQGVSFVLSVILARILMPEEYGIIAMVLVFINIANVFATGGFGEALIQKKDSDEKDFSTMFFCTLGVSILVYALLFWVSPHIAHFYHADEITWILRVLSLKIIISSFSTIQHAYISKNMVFKRFFFSTLVGMTVSGVLGVFLAWQGFGVWALVAQYLSNTVIDVVVLFCTVPWRPKLLFSKESARTLLAFGWKMVGANLINTLYNELRNLVIGRSYSSVDLAYYNKGNQIPSIAIQNIDTAIGNVVFPAMTKTNSVVELKRVGRRAMKTTSYIIFPIMMGLIVVSKPLILLLLTEKWAECIPFMQILCVYWMTQPIQTTNWQIIKAMGRSDLCLKLEVLKKSVGVLLVIVSMQINVMAIAWSAAVFGVISMFINIYPNKKLIGYSLIEQLTDILPSFLLSLAMGAIVSVCSCLKLPLFLLLLLQVIVGVVSYVGLSMIFKEESLLYLINTIRNIIRKK